MINDKRWLLNLFTMIPTGTQECKYSDKKNSNFLKFWREIAPPIWGANPNQIANSYLRSAVISPVHCPVPAPLLSPRRHSPEAALYCPLLKASPYGERWRLGGGFPETFQRRSDTAPYWPWLGKRLPLSGWLRVWFAKHPACFTGKTLLSA